MSKYKIGSWWKLKDAVHGHNFVGQEYELKSGPIGAFLQRKGSNMPWGGIVTLKDINNISEEEWQQISRDGTWEKVDYLSLNHSSTQQSNGELYLAPQDCNCSSKDLFWSGHKCGYK